MGFWGMSSTMLELRNCCYVFLCVASHITTFMGSSVLCLEI